MSIGVIHFKEEGGRFVVAHVAAGTPAYRAGLNAGDEIIAIDGLRTSGRDLPVRLMERKEGEEMELAIFRRDELHTLRVKPERARPRRHVVRRVPDPTPLQTEIYESWLGVEERSGAEPAGHAGQG